MEEKSAAYGYLTGSGIVSSNARPDYRRSHAGRKRNARNCTASGKPVTQ